MIVIVEWIQQNIGLSADFQQRLFTSLGTIFVLWLIRFLARKFIDANVDDTNARFNWRKGVGYVISALGVFLVGRIWLEGIQSLATYLGLLSAGLAISLQAPIVDVIGWLYIIWQRPFSVGDRIQLGDHAGDVIDNGFFNITLMEIGNWVDAEHSTGRLLHIPNKQVFTEVLANYNQGIPFLWNEISVVVTFESDWARAKAILTDVLNENAPILNAEDREMLTEGTRRYPIRFGKVTPIVYTNVEDHGVELTLRYLVKPRQRRTSRQVIWEAVLTAFADEPTIDLAYETRRIFHQNEEATYGKG